MTPNRRHTARGAALMLVALLLGAVTVPPAAFAAAPGCTPGSGMKLSGKKVDAGSQQDLKCADLRNADLSGLTLTQAHLDGVLATGANFKNATLGQSYFDGAVLKGADFTGATMSQATLTGADL